MEIENLQGEIWKVIDHPSIGCYPNYMVSNKGRFKSLNYNWSNKEGLLKPHKNGADYFQICLRREDVKKRWFGAHRLVALMFLPSPNPDNPLEVINLQVNHLDENKTNNSVENLEWCSAQHNTNYGTRTERMLETRKTSIKYKEGRKKTATKQSRPVYQYDQDYQLVNVYISASELERCSDFKQSAICACCLKKRKSHKGFIWSYEPLPNTTNQLTLFPTITKVS